MALKYLKKSLVFSAIFAGIFLFVLSCESPFNPFTTNLGAKVDVEPPLVFDIKPVSGKFIQGEQIFTGSATAYRALHSEKGVEVRIFNPYNKKQFMTGGGDGWTTDGIVITGGDEKEKTFKFTLDTKNNTKYFYTSYTDGVPITNNGMEDGYLRMQFRANDSSTNWNGKNESVELVYVIKNGPSTIKMTLPSSEPSTDPDPDKRNGLEIQHSDGTYEIDENPPDTARVEPGQEIYGNVIDRRGIKPGFPRIKFWKDGDSEPADDDPTNGWATLFLNDIDDYKNGSEIYVDRSVQPVRQIVNFSFGLFEIDRIDRVGSIFQIKYKRDGSGKMTPIPTGKYRFKIWTRDTFFHEEAALSDGTPNPLFMHPDSSRSSDEQDVYKPDPERFPTTYKNGYVLRVENAGEKLNVGLDNTDIGNDDALKEMEPHKYFSLQSNKKIRISAGDIFRLRVLAYNSNLTPIKATLQWKHITSGRGSIDTNPGTDEHPNLDYFGTYLDWDDIYDQGGLVSLGPAGGTARDGHNGAWKDSANQSAGKYFQFTGRTSTAGDPFTPSNEPYALTVRVYSGTGTDPKDYTQMTYQVWVYDTPPTVSIPRVKGADGSLSTTENSISWHNVSVTQNYYTVNGNIEVQVSPSSSFGMMTSPRTMVKWYIEDKSPGDTDSMLAKLDAFKTTPNAANIAFFNNINPAGTANPRSATSGWVENNVFKYNTKNFPDNSYVWLYVIAQDQTYNLGYSLTRLKVDQESDRPKISLTGLFDSTTAGYAAIGDLYIDDSTPNGDIFTPDKTPKNVLGRYDSVRLNLKDDDGLDPAEIQFTLRSIRPDNSSPGTAVTFTGAAVGLGSAGAVRTELNNPLTAQNLARSFYGNTTSNYLEDGFYTLTVNVRDAVSAKVGIGTAADPNNFTTPQDPNYVSTNASSANPVVPTTIHFAVRQETPVITILEPEGSSAVNQDINLRGTVTSRRPLRRLDIYFDPAWGDLPGATSAPNGPEKFTQATTGAINRYTMTYNAATGVYTYSWTSKPVNFITGGDPATAPTTANRSFTVRAWDYLGEYNNATKNLRVDNERPTVRLLQFNYDDKRPKMVDTTPGSRGWQLVNGKINIRIEASDSGGSIKTTNANTHVWWFILPSTGTDAGDDALAADLTEAIFNNLTAYTITDTRFASATVPDTFSGITAGKRGRFTTAQVLDPPSNTRYERVIDTTKLTDNADYILLAIAEDESVNFSRIATPLATFRVLQSSDIPVFNAEDMYPENNAVMGGTPSSNKRIEGSISDDDGFAAAKASFYVSIRFPQSATQWGGWQPVGAEVDTITDRLKFKLTTEQFEANTYLNVEGDKRYQLMIYDGDTPDVTTWPPGKNPDNTAPAGSAIESLQRRTVYLPPGSATNGNTSITANGVSYTFTYKNSKPEIYFKYYDPNPLHKTDFLLPDGVNYDGHRPIFTTKTGLLNALRGANSGANRGHIIEPVLGGVTFTYGTFLADNVTTTNPDANGRRFWTIDEAWLAAFDNANTDGMHTITIKATDTLGNYESVDWTFTKDKTGPEISFSNITEGALAAANIVVPSGNETTIYITGQFTDDYSNIADTYQFRFDSRPVQTGNVVFREVSPNNRPPAKNGTWSILIPGNWNDPPTTPNANFPDGEHTITITNVQDQINTRGIVTGETANNVSTSTAVSFIVDRQVPSMVTTADGTTIADGFRVTGQNGLVTTAGANITNAVLPIEQRAFSASAATAAGAATNTDKVFTLRGVVYEHNLTKLTAAIRNRNTAVTISDYAPELNIPADWPGIWKITNFNTAYTDWYGNGTVGPVTGGDYPGINTANSTFRIRRANTSAADGLGAAANTYYKYLWELDIRVRDFYALLNAEPGMDDDTVTRNVAITASDIAGNNSNQEIWNFKLDSHPPEVRPSWIQPPPAPLPPAPMLEDISIILQGTAKDDNNVRLLAYKLDKYNYATSGWVVPTPGGISGFTNIPHDSASTINWSINNTAVFTTNTAGNPARYASDGRYQISFNVADYSLSNASGGNNASAGPFEFYVDRLAPVFNWTSALDYYQRLDSADKIILNATAWDENGIDLAAGKEPKAVLTGASVPGTVTVAVTAGTTQTGINAANAVPLQVVITDAGHALADGRYTLTLNLQDKAGHRTTDTFTFYLDNANPAIAIEPAGNTNNAVTGRIPLRGTSTKPAGSSPMKRIAVSLDATAPAYNPGDTDTQLRAAGWIFNNGSNGTSDKATLTGNNYNLMHIEEGLSSFNMAIYDTRRLLYTGSPYIGPDLIVGTDVPSGTVLFDGVPVKNGETVNRITLHVLAIDEAGNYTVEHYTYYVYPEGDRPILDAITNPDELTVEASRLLNGRIRLSGTAKDNLRIKNVWFRVLTYEGVTATGLASPALNLAVDDWDDNWNSKTPKQTPVSKRPHKEPNATPGWFRANIGSSTKSSVSWYAYINENNELDLPLGGSRMISIEAIAEDTIQDDNGNWTSTADGLFSEFKKINALVVTEAPEYGDETVVSQMGTKVNGSVDYNTNPATEAGNTNTITWGNIQRTSIRKRAAYSLVVKHNTGVGAIYWTNPPADIPITNTDNLLSDAYRTKYNQAFSSNLSTYGVTVKAEPKDPETGTTLAAGTYLIWKPWTGTTPTLPSTVNADTNKQYTIFTITATETVTAGAVLLKQQVHPTNPDTKWFEWQVIVDINSTVLPYKGSLTDKYNNKADYYNMEFAAVDTSRSAPLTAPKKAQIPIDNLPPKGRYTYNTSVAGTAQLFGGEAGDNEGEIGAIDRVVMWFSRNGASIAWDKAQPFASATSTDEALPDGVSLPSGIAWPKIDYTGGSGNYSSIIIDRHDPQGQTPHHGFSNMKMGLAPTSGALGTSWYVSLDTTKFVSGRITAHFIVYDTAGNATYYSQTLIVLNGVPKISKITLATDLGTVDVAGALGASSANVTFTDTQGAMGRIRSAMGNPSTDTLAGIREPIAVDTKTPNKYNALYDQKDFVVRNKLLAIRIETTESQVAEKDRYYRVEYVSSFRDIGGSAALTNSSTGIRAGRIYMINQPGIENPTGNQAKFPWSVLGAQGEGEIIQKGLVFMAVQDGNDLDLGDYVYQTGTNNQPSVWELNGTYYQGTNPLTRTVPAALAIPDVKYNGTNNTSAGKSAEFVFGTAAFSGNNAPNPTAAAPNTTANHKIRDFTADYTANTGNIDNLGRPKDFDPAYGNGSVNGKPWDYQSLFIIKIFDGSGTTVEQAEADVFGDFALLSIRVNNNDQTPPYAQLYDLNPKAETSAATAGSVGQNGNRVKGGVVSGPTGKSGHIEPRGGTVANRTSLTNNEMGGSTDDSLEYPSAKVASFFTVDTVSGDVIVHGYAEDNQRVGHVSLQIWNENNSAQVGNSITILSTASNSNVLIDGTGVTHTEVVELNRHRVEWAYRWTTESLPAAGLGNFNIRAVAYNHCVDKPVAVSGSGSRPSTPAGAPVATTITGPNYTSKDLLRSDPRNDYDTFNAAPNGFPIGAANNSYYRYNITRVNIRPYMTGFVRSKDKSQHDIRSRQGRYVFRQGEQIVASGFNLRSSGGGTTVLSLNGTSVGTLLVPTAIEAPNYGLTVPVNNNRYQAFSVPTTQTTGNGLVTLTVSNGTTAYAMVNTGAERPMVSSRPVVQPWNKEYNPAKPVESVLWDDYIMVHIWRSNEDDMGAVDRSRFAKSTFIITHPSMSIDPANGTLWASHQENGRKPTPTGGSLYPGGGVYISNNSSTQPYTSPTDTGFTGYSDGLRQIGAFSEHMTYTNMYVDNSSRPWAIANSITKYGEADRWRYLPGMWLWGPIVTDNSNPYNGSPMVSHFPRTEATYDRDGHGIRIGTGTNQNPTATPFATPNFTSGGDQVYHGFRFPRKTGAPTDTGMYAVESLWYNGGTNSRSLAEPQSTEQFHNPHIVTNTAGTHVHVSYYDSKDGSLKYRYNSVGTTGIVHTEASPRRWVNLDGGADVDDNSDTFSAPGKKDAEPEGANYRGYYQTEPERLINGATVNDALSVNSPYRSGTFSIDAATGNGVTTGGTSVTTAASVTRTFTNRGSTGGTIISVDVQNGSYVTTNTPVYTATGGNVTAGAAGFIVLNYLTPPTGTVAGSDVAFRIYSVNTVTASSRILNAGSRSFNNNAGRYNAIAVSGAGNPVIAYYDETSQQLKLAVSDSASPALADNWATHTLNAGIGTGEHVSIQIDGTTFHIAAMNSITKNLMYVTGTLGAGKAAPTNVTARIIDSIGNVGEWCKMSLDSAGNPWIVYMDDGNKGSRDGAKVAFRNTTRFYKGTSGNYENEYEDINGNPITGWETMHVPTRFSVDDAELGMERFPTRRNTGATRGSGGGLANFGAVGYLGEDYYRIAYYVD